MKEYNYAKIQKYLTIFLGVLMAGLLTVLCIVPNVEAVNTRQNEGYTLIDDVSYREISDSAAPVGTVREFVFYADEEIEHDETLVFSCNHQNADVYIGGEKVYSQQSAGELFNIKTSGYNWAMIPIYREDAGKEIKVLLTPVYSNYMDSNVEFMLGSKLAIYKTAFDRALPELLLSLCNVLIGLFLLGIGVYHTIKHNAAHRLYAVGMLAVSAGVWRITYGSFIYLIIENHNVFVYTLSLISLMFVALALLNCVEAIDVSERREKIRYPKLWETVKNIANGQTICVISVIYCVIDILQLILQAAGVLDLRQMLKATHGMIVLSAAILCICSIFTWFESSVRTNRLFSRSYSWLLGIGVIIDMLLYYFADTSVGMLFTLTAIMCFSVLEGIKLLVGYTEQKNLIEEMGMRLKLSRTTTMLSQIRSHFVFNILNAISGMCKYDPEKADETVIRFARYLRNNIDIMEDDKPILFSTELEHLRDYVALEQIRFGDKIKFVTDIRTDSFMIPPLILQPIVENAIKHGIMQKTNGGTVTLRAWEDEGNIKISVQDDGVGFDTEQYEKSENTKSVGLRNIRYRICNLVHGELTVESRLGEGSAVTVIIPKKEA